MANLNKVMLIGRLTRDPETRHTQGGSSVTNFGLAVNRSYRRKDSDETVEETTFVDVEAWGKTGETFARYMKKGRQAYVEGRLKLDTWEKEGQKHSKIRVVMEEFQFLDGGNGGGGGSAEGAPRARRPMPARAGAPGAPGAAAEGGGAPSGETPQDDYAPFDDDIPF
jgi:single-strand DNA-binding protein